VFFPDLLKEDKKSAPDKRKGRGIATPAFSIPVSGY